MVGGTILLWFWWNDRILRELTKKFLIQLVLNLFCLSQFCDQRLNAWNRSVFFELIIQNNWAELKIHTVKLDWKKMVRILLF